jgi:hypothetical protein
MHEYGHLRRARRERVDAWFGWAVSSATGYWQDHALEALLPYVTAPQRRQAVAIVFSNEMLGISDWTRTFADWLTADEVDSLSQLQVVVHTPRGAFHRSPWPGLLGAARRCSRGLWERCVERFARRAMENGEDERLRLAAALLDDMERLSPGLAEALAEALLGGGRSRGAR